MIVNAEMVDKNGFDEICMHLSRNAAKAIIKALVSELNDNDDDVVLSLRKISICEVIDDTPKHFCRMVDTLQ